LLACILGAVAGEDGPPTFGSVNLAHAHFIENVSFARVRFSERADFEGAQFNGDVGFSDAQFSGDAVFPGAQFSGDADFEDAQFSRYAEFGGAQFSAGAGFGGAQFSEGAGFGRAQFSRDVEFGGAQFGYAEFGRAQFSRNAEFEGAQFSTRADFTNARFEKATSFGALAAGNLLLQRAIFLRPVVLKAAAVSITCTDTTWEAGATIRLRHARVDLERATFTVPSFLVGADRPFALTAPSLTDLDESRILSRVPEEGRVPDDPWVPILLSLRGADASNLSVTDVDLSQCRFAGARLLDQIRLEGRCIFDHPPEGLQAGRAWPPVWRWSRRQSLAEERLWQATRPKYQDWAPSRSTVAAEVRPERLAGLYRQLRKAQEDAKNQPGAADFYYGEMEMRRHADTTPAAERAIIRLYWLISGYGLRALRSLGALLVVGVIVTTALVGWGLAATAPPQHMTDTATTAPHNPTQINAIIRTTTPQLPPASQRWTSQRTGTAVEVALESMVFRSSNQPLTTAGTWTTIAARVLGPVLLFLALLAARNRVKR
jgi:uncharacterized protein YjbI with pentapeptide repeats